jgi:hypothetical protein
MAYATMRITVHSDKVPALSGIIERLQSHGMGR